ncbi:hypothetical protein SNE40_015810 [Patella caerulea]|uniref:Uncharacterized protein n=1 Tax=Patella caerulea TaxID=87958 RepID=A0AAN8PSL2_PATCE
MYSYSSELDVIEVKPREDNNRENGADQPLYGDDSGRGLYYTARVHPTNQYDFKRLTTEASVNFSLLMANFHQLKAVLTTDKLNKNYFLVNLILLVFSIFGQTVLAVLQLVLWYKERSRRQHEKRKKQNSRRRDLEMPGIDVHDTRALSIYASNSQQIDQMILGSLIIVLLVAIDNLAIHVLLGLALQDNNRGGTIPNQNLNNMSLYL